MYDKEFQKILILNSEMKISNEMYQHANITILETTLLLIFTSMALVAFFTSILMNWKFLIPTLLVIFLWEKVYRNYCLKRKIIDYWLQNIQNT